MGGANYMELERLKGCLQYIDSNAISYNVLVTDRHSQIQKFIRTEKQEKTHHFDVFHVAKGIDLIK